MIDLLILMYAAILWVIFKVFKVPINKWTVTTSILVGVLWIGLVVITMNYNHPYSREARLYFYTTPVYPRVNGRVVEVPVAPNTPLAKGDILFRFDPRPFEDDVASLRGDMTGAQVERDRVKEEYDRSLQLLERGAGSERETQRWRIQYESALADILSIQGRLDRALFDLEEEVIVRAPSAGYVTQVRVRPGMALLAQPQGIAAMTFVHAGEMELWAGFLQNGMQNLKVGHDAEVTFDGIPGRAFSGHVEKVSPAIAQGQLVPSGELINFDMAAQRAQQGRIAIMIAVDDDLSEYHIPAGSKAEVAVYSENWKAFSIIRRVLLRMKSWQKFIFPGG
ncbi:MAG: HlyD family secretion protein [Gammaproteobacteria bacterium]|nr:HlyD family secretion protein [Gammaproteobacteria bacterium]